MATLLKVTMVCKAEEMALTLMKARRVEASSKGQLN